MSRAARGSGPWDRLPACLLEEDDRLEAYPTGQTSLSVLHSRVPWNDLWRASRQRTTDFRVRRSARRHTLVATVRQNVGDLACVPALWRGAATAYSGPREANATTDSGVFCTLSLTPSPSPRGRGEQEGSPEPFGL